MDAECWRCPVGRYTREQREEALRVLDECGGDARRAAPLAGVPRSTLMLWASARADGRDPSERKAAVHCTPKQRTSALARLARGARAAEVASDLGVTPAAVLSWARRAGLTGEVRAVLEDPGRGRPEPPGDPEGRLARIAELEAEVERLRFQRDLALGLVDVVKKDPGADLSSLTNRERAALAERLREGRSLSSVLAELGLARSTYYYERARLAAPDPLAALRVEVRRVFEAHGGRWGYRRIWADLRHREEPWVVSEKVVRRAMREEGLEVAYDRKRLRSYSSYAGEADEAPPNLLLREDGTHGFSAPSPNELWLSDITEFRIPAGKVYLSPVLDCFDGALAGWSVGLRPTAGLANSSLERACEGLAPGEAPTVHTDRGGHYRWEGWKAICEARGLTRSMSRKATSPDNARMEGFFGTLKNEFFHFRDWEGVSLAEFCELLDGWLRYYNDERPKASLGWMSPRGFRESRGLSLRV